MDNFPNELFFGNLQQSSSRDDLHTLFNRTKAEKSPKNFLYIQNKATGEFDIYSRHGLCKIIKFKMPKSKRDQNWSRTSCGYVFIVTDPNSVGGLLALSKKIFYKDTKTGTFHAIDIKRIDPDLRANAERNHNNRLF